LLDSANLDHLEHLAGPTLRAAVELGAAVGRRTAELCGLAFTCLDYDEHVDDHGHTNPQARNMTHTMTPRKVTEQIATTNIYLHADMTQKQEAIDRTKPLAVRIGRYRPPDSLIAFLEGL
jgi:hypothetical protein